MPKLHALSLLVLLTTLTPLSAQETKRTFAVRIDGRVVGHMTETELPVHEDERTVLRFHTKTLIKVEVLGAHIDQRVEQTWLLAPDTRQTLSFTAVQEAGPQKLELAGRLVEAGFQLDNGGEPLDPDKVIISPELRWLRDRGPTEPGQTVEADYLVPEMASVQRVKITLPPEPDRSIDVLGTATPVRVYEMLLPQLGIETTVFLRRSDYEIVRYEMPAQKLVMERVPPAVVERIERVDMTESILVETNLDIEDPAVLTFLRVRADIEGTADITAESLNVPGQTFVGTVEDGRIVGEFTIRPRRTDGTGTPPFPVPDGTFAAPQLQSALAPEENIESDDPGIVAKAQELAAGATTCLQVVERLARWTHDEIPYEIPGGGSAKRTFALRAGECGGHSRVLAAMLRSLGIPARTPMGGMYVPLYGGSFAQHMWTEVWLGDDIGWLPVDCTANQPTFIDAGHIRLSNSLTRFAPKSVEVLDHEPKLHEGSGPAPRRTDAFPFAVDETLVYTWSRAGKALGEESITYRGRKDGAHVFESSIDLGGGSFGEKTRSLVGDDGRLLAFHVDRKAGETAESIDVALAADGMATVNRKSTEGDRSQTTRVDASVFALHNNCTAHFVIAVERAGPFAEGTQNKVRLFHTEQRTAFSMTLVGKGQEEIDVRGTRVLARIVEADLVGLLITLHVDDRGRVLRYYQKTGDVTIALDRP